MCERARARPLALLVLGVTLTVCGRTPVPTAVRLGTSLPTSGPEAAVGLAIRHGYERAVAEANAAGGVRLRGSPARVPVRLEVHDDGGDAARVEEIAEMLAQGGVHVLLGTSGAVRAAVQSGVAERLAVPLVVNTWDADGLPGPRATWTRAVPATGSAETRGHDTARAAIRWVEAAGSVHRAALLHAAVP